MAVLSDFQYEICSKFWYAQLSKKIVILFMFMLESLAFKIKSLLFISQRIFLNLFLVQECKMMLFCPISNSNKENLKDSFNIIFTGMIFMLAILTLARVIMLFQFALSPFSEISFKEQLGFFILSLRFDLKIITIAYSLPLLLTICLFSFNFFKYIKKFLPKY